jgi:hypothetical protein
MNGDMKQRQQMHLFFLSNSLSPTPIDVTFWAGLAQLCKAAFVSQSLSNTRFSDVKQDLKRVLRMLVPEEVLEEQVLDYSWFLVDVQLAGTKVIIEVEGPSHYFRVLGQKGMQETRVLNGSTCFKHRCLVALGWTVLHVPSYDWVTMNSDADKGNYLRASLGLRARGP